MLSIFNLDSYKEYLYSYRTEGIDNTLEIKENQRKTLESRYSDEYLQSIIDNTKEFVFNLLEGFSGSEILIDIFDTEDIFVNALGGWTPDKIIHLDDLEHGYVISNYLLEQLLGNTFKITIDYEETEYFDEDEEYSIGAIYAIPRIYIAGDFQKRKEELRQEKINELVRVLKKNS